MGKFKKIVQTVCFSIISLFVVIGSLDYYINIKDQHRISRTNCYLMFESNTLTVNLIYKRFPFLTRYKTLLRGNVSEVYWNDKGDILAVDRNKRGIIVCYYLLSCTNDKRVSSPFEPYSISFFPTENALRKYLSERGIVFTAENHYYYPD